MMARFLSSVLIVVLLGCELTSAYPPQYLKPFQQSQDLIYPNNLLANPEPIIANKIYQLTDFVSKISKLFNILINKISSRELKDESSSLGLLADAFPTALETVSSGYRLLKDVGTETRSLIFFMLRHPFKFVKLLLKYLYRFLLTVLYN